MTASGIAGSSPVSGPVITPSPQDEEVSAMVIPGMAPKFSEDTLEYPTQVSSMVRIA